MCRYWINQPSTLQPLHKLHGQNVIVGDEAKLKTQEYVKVYLTKGDVYSMEVPVSCLAPGWKEIK